MPPVVDLKAFLMGRTCFRFTREIWKRIFRWDTILKDVSIENGWKSAILGNYKHFQECVPFFEVSPLICHIFVSWKLLMQVVSFHQFTSFKFFYFFSDGLVICHLPFGPTAYFTLSNTVMRHDVPDIGTMSEAYPHLVFHNFTSKLGERVGSFFLELFFCYFYSVGQYYHINELGRRKEDAIDHFYSCVLSCRAFEWKWGWSWPCFDRDHFFSYANSY